MVIEGPAFYNVKSPPQTLVVTHFLMRRRPRKKFVTAKVGGGLNVIESAAFYNDQLRVHTVARPEGG